MFYSQTQLNSEIAQIVQNISSGNATSLLTQAGATILTTPVTSYFSNDQSLSPASSLSSSPSLSSSASASSFLLSSSFLSSISSVISSALSSLLSSSYVSSIDSSSLSSSASAAFSSSLSSSASSSFSSSLSSSQSSSLSSSASSSALSSASSSASSSPSSSLSSSPLSSSVSASSSLVLSSLSSSVSSSVSSSSRSTMPSCSIGGIAFYLPPPIAWPSGYTGKADTNIGVGVGTITTFSSTFGAALTLTTCASFSQLRVIALANTSLNATAVMTVVSANNGFSVSNIGPSTAPSSTPLVNGGNTNGTQVAAVHIAGTGSSNDPLYSNSQTPATAVVVSVSGNGCATRNYTVVVTNPLCSTAPTFCSLTFSSQNLWISASTQVYQNSNTLGSSRALYTFPSSQAGGYTQNAILSPGANSCGGNQVPCHQPFSDSLIMLYLQTAGASAQCIISARVNGFWVNNIFQYANYNTNTLTSTSVVYGGGGSAAYALGNAGYLTVTYISNQTNLYLVNISCFNQNQQCYAEFNLQVLNTTAL